MPRTSAVNLRHAVEKGRLSFPYLIHRAGSTTADASERQMPLALRLRLFLSHLLISAGAVSALVAVVLLIWYPRPLFTLQGAPFILMIVVFVDAVIGPLLTLIVASPTKPRRELIRDLAIIGTVQLAALTYGAHSLFIARPAFVVFNADRFDAVLANELVENPAFPYRDPRFAKAQVFGPVWVAASPPDSVKERNELLFATVQGGPDIKDIPALYEEWPQAQRFDADRLKPLGDLMAISDDANQVAVHAMRVSGLTEQELAYLPLVGRERTGVVILNRRTLAVVYASDVAPKY